MLVVLFHTLKSRSISRSVRGYCSLSACRYLAKYRRNDLTTSDRWQFPPCIRRFSANSSNSSSNCTARSFSSRVSPFSPLTTINSSSRVTMDCVNSSVIKNKIPLEVCRWRISDGTKTQNSTFLRTRRCVRFQKIPR